MTNDQIHAYLAEVQILVRFLRKKFYKYDEISKVLADIGFTNKDKSPFTPSEIEKIQVTKWDYRGVSKSRYRTLVQKLPTRVRL